MNKINDTNMRNMNGSQGNDDDDVLNKYFVACSNNIAHIKLKRRKLTEQKRENENFIVDY
jgi:hypothetical protein